MFGLRTCRYEEILLYTLRCNYLQHLKNDNLSCSIFRKKIHVGINLKTFWMNFVGKEEDKTRSGWNISFGRIVLASSRYECVGGGVMHFIKNALWNGCPMSMLFNQVKTFFVVFKQICQETLIANNQALIKLRENNFFIQKY